MIFQIVFPFESTIYGDSFKDAINVFLYKSAITKSGSITSSKAIKIFILTVVSFSFYFASNIALWKQLWI